MHIISCYVLLGVSMVAEEVGYYFAPSGVSRFDDFFIVFSLLSSSRNLLRLSNNLAARDLLGLWYSLIILLHLLYCIICQFAALLPLVTSPTIHSRDVLEPQPGVTGENRLFLALGVQDRYPAVLSTSLHRLGFISWLRCLGS